MNNNGNNRGTLEAATKQRLKAKKDTPFPIEAADVDDDAANYVLEEDKRKIRSGFAAAPVKKPLVAAGRCCQAEGCTADLTEAKLYHRRHKVCELHAKAQAVVVAGIPQRFCQQCSRFHEVPEFDDAKRSCRRRLAGHNERRRKNTAETQLADGGSSGSRGGGGGQGSENNGCDQRGRIQHQDNSSNCSYNKHFQIR